ncbi:Peptidase C48, SUMO/Sentrin/Ubl1 [Corchorus capsularis]|uniref:Peptidase C48, SUMO/Sentrin/Ubl1 n=1 Tax=Corchorus capsularis TaxID=210143 RepID=A0A1R3G6H0_COCAP|nr:Peptidase C48, SUMO/Sentrin/Ubl1 [Corchorus capsularis]
MGALASNRKRGGDEYFNFNFNHTIKAPYSRSPDFQVSKRPRFSSLIDRGPEKEIVSSKNAVSRISRYPEVKHPFPREVHGPVRTHKFGVLPSISNLDSNISDEMGNIWTGLRNARRQAFDSLRYFPKEKEVVFVEDDDEKEKEKEAVSDCSVEEVEIIEKGKNDVQEEERNLQPSSSSAVTELNNGSLRVENALGRLSLNPEVYDPSDLEAYRKLLQSSERRDPKLKDLKFQIELFEKRKAALQSLRPAKKQEEEEEEVIPNEPFVPLSKEENAEVSAALSPRNGRKMLVLHKASSIEIRGEVLQCLRPGQWLNDEVINLYLELLKERENREPGKFLKCHFFNTFFYKKLVSPDGSYNYRAVKRWTSQKKLGYSLIDCDKIFVPIHKDIHWCLAVINKKDQKFQYLDSLKGKDPRVLNALAKYFVEEVKDKSGKDIDVSSWEREFVGDLPAQQNGFDCGMFMLKYIDFYSRGLRLCFDQEHMPYFRLRTANEILRLRAD